jgi:hypothetical protein
MDEDELGDLVWTAQQMIAAEDGEIAAEIGFFLIAWAAERITAQRISAGDLGIDDADARLLDLRRQAGLRQAATQYQELVDEIYIETLGDFREFTMVVLFLGRRESFFQRFANGQRLLAKLLPAHNTNDARPLALAG